MSLISFLVFGFYLVLSPIHLLTLSSNGLYAQTKAPAETQLEHSPAAVEIHDNVWRIHPSIPIYGGKIIDSKKFRPAKNVKVVGIEGTQYLQFENFLHNNKYHTAFVPLDFIESYQVQLQPFDIAGVLESGHVQARFVIQQGHSIILENDNGNLIENNVIRDLIISYEAALPKGVVYNAPHFVLPRVPRVGRVVSGTQKKSEGEERIFRQFNITYSPAELKNLLKRFIYDSERIGMSEFYRTHNDNCAIPIFDNMDLMMREDPARYPSFNPQPFQLILGADSISGPTINALYDRFHNHPNVQVTEIQDMKDEHNGKVPFGQTSVGEDVQKRELQGALKLVLLRPDLSNLSREQKQVVESLLKDVEAALPEATNEIIAGVMATISSTDGAAQLLSGFGNQQASANLNAVAQALSQTLGVLKARLRRRINHFSDQLPDRPIGFHIALTDHPATGVTDLNEHDIRVGLPMEVINQSLSDHPRRRNRILPNLLQGIKSTMSGPSDTAPAFLKAALISLSMQRGSEEAIVNTQIQTVLGLPYMNQEVEITGDDPEETQQVELNRVESPRPSIWERSGNAIKGFLGGSSQPKPVTLVMTFSDKNPQGHSTNEGDLDLNLRMRFGRNSGLKLEIQENGLLEVTLPDTPTGFGCVFGRSPYAPNLTGVFGPTPLEDTTRFNRFLNWLLRGKKTQLAITDVDMHLNELKLKTTRVRVGALGLRCFEMESVNEQVTDQAQEALIKGLETLPLEVIQNFP